MACESAPEAEFDCDRPDCSCTVLMDPADAQVAREFADGVRCDCH